MPTVRRRRQNLPAEGLHGANPEDMRELQRLGSRRPRHSVSRFLANLDAVEEDVLRSTLALGYQLSADAVEGNLAPCVVILAAYARRVLDMELVDDFDELIARQRQAFQKYCHHPDLFFASCVVILHAVGDQPSVEAFRDIGASELFNELVEVEDESE